MKKQTFLINQRGSVEDVRCSLRSGSNSKTDLLKALENEIKNKNRGSVIAMLQSSLKKTANQS